MPARVSSIRSHRAGVFFISSERRERAPPPLPHSIFPPFERMTVDLDLTVTVPCLVAPDETPRSPPCGPVGGSQVVSPVSRL